MKMTAPSGAPVADVTGLLLAAASGIVTSGLGYAAWYAVLPWLGTTRAAAVQLAVPVLAAVGGIVFLGETATLRLALTSVAILGGIAVVLQGRRRPEGPSPASVPPVGDADQSRRRQVST
jgi:drug/metabolite transporter (DMT)-like permease